VQNWFDDDVAGARGVFGERKALKMTVERVGEPQHAITRCHCPLAVWGPLAIMVPSGKRQFDDLICRQVDPLEPAVGERLFAPKPNDRRRRSRYDRDVVGPNELAIFKSEHITAATRYVEGGPSGDDRTVEAEHVVGWHCDPFGSAESFEDHALAVESRGPDIGGVVDDPGESTCAAGCEPVARPAVDRIVLECIDEKTIVDLVNLSIVADFLCDGICDDECPVPGGEVEAVDIST
jgi:hypothetical protein